MKWYHHFRSIYNTLAFSLLHREQDEKFTDIENEFRIIAYDCPRVKNGKLIQIPRETMIYGTYGMTYKEDVAAVKESFSKMLENGTYKGDLFSDL